MIIKNTTDTKIKLDKYDEKILYYLSHDYRQSKKRLAKKLKISENKLRYKIGRLEKILIKPKANFNYPKLNIPSFIVITGELAPSEYNQVIEDDGTYFSYQLVGNKYMFNILTTDILAFCKQRMPQISVKIFPLTNYISETYSLFGHELTSREKEHKVTLNQVTYKILYALSLAPSGSYTTLAKIAKVSRLTVAKKMKDIIGSEILHSIRYSMNMFKMDLHFYILQIRFKPKMYSKIREVLEKDHFTGFTYESYNTLFHQYCPRNKQDLYNFITKLSSIDSSAQIVVMENSGNYCIEPVPLTAVRSLKKMAQLTSVE